MRSKVGKEGRGGGQALVTKSFVSCCFNWTRDEAHTHTHTYTHIQTRSSTRIQVQEVSLKGS